MSSPTIDQWICGCVLAAEGNVLRTTSAALLAQAALVPSDFAEPKARVLWAIFLKLNEKRRPCTVDSVFAFGRGGKMLAEKDIAWIREWEDAAIVLDRQRFGDMVDAKRKVLRAASLAARLEEAAAQLRANDPNIAGVVDELQEAARLALASIADETSRGDMDLAAIADQWDRVDAGEAESDIITTGFPELDRYVGGYYPNLNLIIGKPSEGKSAFVGTSIAELLKLTRVGLVGLEDGTAWLQRRHLARTMGINARDVGRVKRDAALLDKFASATEELAPLMHNLWTFPRGGITTSKLLSICERWHEEGVRVIFVDHGGELDHSSDKVDEHRLRVGLSYKRMRDFATRTGVKMVVVAPTRRADDRDTEPRPPRIDEVRDTSEIDYAVRMGLGIWSVPGEAFVRITSVKVTEGERYKTVAAAKVAGGVLLDPEDCTTIDLFAEKMAKAKAKKEQRDAERKEAAERRAAEKKAAAEARANAKAKGQGSMFNGGSEA